jgi:hypothetical protein
MRIIRRPCRAVLGFTLCCTLAFAQLSQKASRPVAAQIALAAPANAPDAAVKAQAVPETTPGAERAGWGQAIDPDKDCKLTPGPRSLTIDLPAAWHDLAGPPLASSTPLALYE